MLTAEKTEDLIHVIQNWGASCPAFLPALCTADVNGDTIVNVLDLLEVIFNWT